MSTKQLVARNKKIRTEITKLTKRLEAAAVEGDQTTIESLRRDIRDLKAWLDSDQ